MCQWGRIDGLEFKIGEVVPLAVTEGDELHAGNGKLNRADRREVPLVVVGSGDGQPAGRRELAVEIESDCVCLKSIRARMGLLMARSEVEFAASVVGRVSVVIGDTFPAEIVERALDEDCCTAGDQLTISSPTRKETRRSLSAGDGPVPRFSTEATN